MSGLPRNDFEEVVFEQHRSLGRLKEATVAGGSLAAMMTGSGSALFGLFRSGPLTRFQRAEIVG